MIAIIKRNLQFPQFNVAQAGNFWRVQRVRAVGAEGFEGVVIAAREMIGAAAQVEAELFTVEFAFAFGAGVDTDFVVLWGEDDDVVALGAEVEDFGFLGFHFGRTSEDVAVADEEPEFAVEGIEFDASGLMAAMVEGEPTIEGRSERGEVGGEG